jgi:hypothetical protein
MKFAAVGLTLLCMATTASADDSVERACWKIWAERPVFVNLSLDADGVLRSNGERIPLNMTLDEYFEQKSRMKHVYFRVSSKEMKKPRMKDIVTDAKRHGLIFRSECAGTIQ